MEFELRRIKSAFAGKLFPAEFLGVAAGHGHGIAERLFRPVPHFIRTETLVGTQRQLNRILVKSEVAVDAVEQVAEGDDLVDQLVLTDEDVRVVLSKLANTQDSVERAVRLVAVATAEF